MQVSDWRHNVFVIADYINNNYYCESIHLRDSCIFCVEVYCKDDLRLNWKCKF